MALIDKTIYYEDKNQINKISEQIHAQVNQRLNLMKKTQLSGFRR
jgi:hypothetical protein